MDKKKGGGSYPYVLCHRTLIILQRWGISLNCPYCSEPLKIGENVRTIRADRNDGQHGCFHVPCYENYKEERRERLGPSLGRGRPRINKEAKRTYPTQDAAHVRSDFSKFDDNIEFSKNFKPVISRDELREQCKIPKPIAYTQTLM
jgi:hypothetical protein